MKKTVTVHVPAKDLALCNIKAREAKNLTLDDTRNLITWCDYQSECYWEGLTIQEILNVYRISAKWISFEAWISEDEAAAVAAYNAVVDEHNRFDVKED